MIQLLKYFALMFISPRISRSRLKDFCESHIARLLANNPGGIFTTILTAITDAYNAYFGHLASEATNVAVQKGKTAGMAESRMVLEKLISKDEKLFDFKYGFGSPTYLEFIPRGLTEYNDADIATFGTITLRLKGVIATHAADFDTDFIDEYNQKQQIFVDNRAAQNLLFGKVAGERSDIATSKAVVCNQLTYNLLTIAREYIGHEDKCDVFFDQSILNAAFKETESKVTSDLNPMKTENIFDNTAGPDTKYKSSVHGDGAAAYIGFAKNATDAITVDTGKTIDERSAPVYTAAELGYTSDKIYLNITSASGITISYTVERV